MSLSASGCSVSTVKNPVPLANLYRLQPIATDSKKTMYSVSTVQAKRLHLTALVHLSLYDQDKGILLIAICLHPGRSETNPMQIGRH